MKDVNSEGHDQIAAFATLMGSDVPYYYTMVPRKGKKGEKVEGYYSDVMAAPEYDDWKDHLNGGTALSIVLNCADDDRALTMVRRITVDSDDYELSAEKICRQAEAQRIPCQVTRSKSGGGHIHLFFGKKIDAERGRRIGFQVAAALDLNEFEVFPKQGEVDAVDRKGNGMNLPYYGDERWGVQLGPDGEAVPMTLEEFIAGAKAVALTLDEVAVLEKRLPEPKKQETRKANPEEYLRAAKLNHEGQPFYNGPPCLQTLVADGQRVGSHRNDFLYNVGVFHRFVDPLIEQDAMIDALMTANNLYCDPPLKTGEVTSTARSVFKTGKKASYKCKDEPICSVCVRDTCKTRPFGVALRGMSLPFSIEIVQPEQQTPTNFLEDRPVLHVTDKDEIPLRLEFDSFADPNFSFGYIKKVLFHRVDFLAGLDAGQFNTMVDAAVAAATRTVLRPDRQEAGVAAAALEAYLLASSHQPKVSEFYSDGLQLTGFWLHDGKKHGMRRTPPDGMTHVLILDRFLSWSVTNGRRLSPERLLKGLEQLVELGLVFIAGRSVNLTSKRAAEAKKDSVWVKCIWFNPEGVNRWLAHRTDAAVDEDDDVAETLAEVFDLPAGGDLI